MFNWKLFLSYTTHKPGVYIMFDVNEYVLYVGKAKNLKKRLTSYSKTTDIIKTQKLVAKISKIETIVTNNEVEALLLEQNLVKQYKPPYNILLRDDKTYPYIELSYDKYPKISYFRGNKKTGNYYYGPFVDIHAVKESIGLIQKLFNIRSCTDAYFKNRSRPCLQYQIQNCTAPCTNLITEEDYKENVNLAKMFLSGKSSQINETLKEQMLNHAKNLDFEKAANVRDILQKINSIQTPQVIQSGLDNVDVFYLLKVNNLSCVNFLMVRNGNIIGSTNISPTYSDNEDLEDILFAVLSHYYLSDINNFPNMIITNLDSEQYKLLHNAIYNLHNVKIDIKMDFNNKYLNFAKENAENALNSYINQAQTIEERYQQLKEKLNINDIKRVECFDVSHLQGESTVASNVVFDQNGANRRLYRHYKITGVTLNDDYGAMKQALMKRFQKSDNLPNILIVDGGIGQMNVAIEVLKKLQINLLLLAVSKGEQRKPGLETIYLNSPDNIIEFDKNSKALHLIQHIRDEAHNYAVKQHIKSRTKIRKISILENIKGVGAEKRNNLLTYFGGLQQIKEASIERLMKVNGISKSLAKDIYYYFHSENIIYKEK